MDRELGFGIIGCGMISQWHADSILALGGARIVGATDANEEVRAAFAQKYRVHAFNTVKELLDDDGIHIVCICTPSGLHAPLAIQAAAAGKHIIVEKPMAITLAEADEVIAACDRHRVKLAVISQLRFSDAVLQLKNAVDRQMLGKLVEGDIIMKYYRSQQYYDRGGWRGTWKMDGGGALMNQGIHGVDLIQYIMGPVGSIFAYTRTLARRIETEDTVAAVLEFTNGALGVIQATTSIYPGFPRRLEVHGDRGTVVLEEDCITRWDVEGQASPDGVQVKHTAIGSSNDPAAFGKEGHIKQIGDMIDAVRNNGAPLIDQYEGRKPIEIITAIYESSKTNRPVLLARRNMHV